MRQSEAKDFLPLIQAFAEGKTIQAKIGDRWGDLEEATFARPVADYRIKPEPRTFYAVDWNDSHLPSLCDSQARAQDAARDWRTGGCRVITLREVLDE